MAKILLKDLAVGSNYLVQVRSRNSQGTSDYSPILSLATQADTVAPGVVTNVRLNGGGSSITALWDAVTDQDMLNGFGTYRVQLDTSSSFNSTTLRDVKTSGTVVSFPNLLPNTAYFIRIQAIDPAGNAGAWSGIISAGTGSVAASLGISSVKGEVIIANTLAGDRVIANSLDAATLKAGTAFTRDLTVASNFTLGTGGKIVAGDVAGSHVEIQQTGLKVFALDSIENSVAREVISLGSDTDDYFGIVNAAGDNVGSINNRGEASFSQLNVSGDPEFGGRRLSKIVENQAKVVAWASAEAGASPIVTEFGLMESAFFTEPNRFYEIHFSFSYSLGQDLAELQVRLRDAGSTQPTLNSPLAVHPLQFSGGPSNYNKTVHYAIPWTPPAGLHRLLLSASSNGSPYHVNVNNTPVVQMWLEDKGLNVANSGVLSRAGGTLGSTSAAPSPQPQPSPAAPMVQRLWEGDASWSRSYRGGGGFRTDTTDAIQGYSPNSSSNGNQRSMIGWPDLVPILAGSRIDLVEVRLFANMWHSYSGGEAIIGTHGNGGPPNEFTGTVPDRTRSAGWPRPGERWVNMTAISPQDWTNGAIRGITLGPGPTTGTLYYGRFNGAGQPAPPRLRILYTK